MVTLSDEARNRRTFWAAIVGLMVIFGLYLFADYKGLVPKPYHTKAAMITLPISREVIG